jgi:hypothetical protein
MFAPRRLILAALVPALAVPLGCGRGDGTKLTLRYHPPAGATYQYSLEQRTDMTFAGGPMAQVPEQHLTMHMYFTQTVTGPTAGGVGLTVRFDSITMESPLMAKGGYGPALDRMRGLKRNVVYDDRMNEVHAEFTNVGGALSPITEQLGKNLKEMTFPLPQGPIGVGDSWTAEMELPINQIASGGGPPMTATTKLTVKEIHADGPDTTVQVALATSFPSDPIKVVQQGQVLTLKLAGTLTGEQLFSVTRGAVVRSLRTGTMRIKMTGAMLGPEGTKMSVKQEISLQLSEAK